MSMPCGCPSPRPRAAPGEQQAKRALILKAKDVPCPICVAQGIVTPLGPGRWPARAMSLNHLDPTEKSMWFATGIGRIGPNVSYTEHTLACVERELQKARAVCLNHHAEDEKS